MIKTVIFDLDDTILDHKHSAQFSLQQLKDNFPVFDVLAIDELQTLYATLQEHFHQFVLSGEYTVTQSRYERFKALLQHVKPDANHAEIEAVAERYKIDYRQSERLVDGVVALIQALRDDGIKIGLLTNNASAEQRAKLNRHNLEALFDAIIISGEVGIAKPDPQIFNIALGELDAQADETVMIGDSWGSDILGANGIGMRAIWLNRYSKKQTYSELIREMDGFTPLEKTMATVTNW